MDEFAWLCTTLNVWAAPSLPARERSFVTSRIVTPKASPDPRTRAKRVVHEG